MDPNVTAIINTMVEQARQHREDTAALIAQLMQNQRPQGEIPVEVPVVAPSYNLYKNLSGRMTMFSYCPEDNLTFDRWYDRYSTIFTEDALPLSVAQRVSLLTEKLSDADYQRFADRILPETKQTVTFEKAVEELKQMFGRKESLFSLRYKCLRVEKDLNESYDDYTNRINLKCEKFDVANCSADDLKVLMFVTGLNKSEESHTLEKLLIKLEEVEVSRGAAANPDTVPKLKLKDVCAIAKRLSHLKVEKTMVQQPESTAKSEILSLQKRQKQPRSHEHQHKPPEQEPKAPPKPCVYCGGNHWHKDCSYKEKECVDCKQKGHKAGFCVAAAKFIISLSKKYNRRSERRQSLAVKTVSVSTRKFVEPAIDNTKVRLQLDSGSDWTIISQENWKRIGSPKLSNCEEKAISASGDHVDMLGKFTARLRLHGEEDVGPCYVAKSDLNLLGSDWMEVLKLWDVPIASVCNSIHLDGQSQLEREVKLKFPILFTDSLGLCTEQASLTLKPGSKPIFRKARPVPFAAAEPIETELKRLQLLGVITPVKNSAYAAPIVAVKKRDGRVRICADYSTGLNDSLEPEQFPLPTPDEIFAQLSPYKLFSKIDLSDAFLQVEVDDESKQLMTINTHCGLFRVNRLQPGVKPAQAIFQKLVTSMMSGSKGAFPFIDDFIVGGKDEKDHKENLFEVLSRIQDHGFHLRIDKCLFGRKELEFLGHIINESGIKPGPEKIEVLRQLPAPTNIQQLQAFLGAVTWYQKFVPGIKKLRGPLDELLSEDVDFEWLSTHEEAFKGLKEVLRSDLALIHYDPKKDLVVAADASSYGIGAVLLHKFPDKSTKATLKPIMHAARSFTAAEKNYPQIQREALALTFALQKFHRYIYGRKFELQTDHQPLLAIFGNKKGIPVHTASRLQRYALILLAYDFDIKYVSTKSFAYADFISRLISQHEKPDEEVVIGNIEDASHSLKYKNEDFIGKIVAESSVGCFAIDTAKTNPVTFEAIQNETGQDESLKTLLAYIENGWPRKGIKITDQVAAVYSSRRDSLTVIKGCIFFGDRIFIPKRYRNEILIELHQGHPGIERMKLLARQKVSWPSLDDDIEKTVRKCTDCATESFSPIKAKLSSWPFSTTPWSRIHIDFAGPINNFYYFVIIDAFSKWPEVFKMQSITAQQTTERLDEVFSRHGLCDTIVSDNGPQFISDHFKQFRTERGIEHITIAPYHPQSNGQAERFVQTLKQGLKKLAREGNANEVLRKFLAYYRFTPSYNLGMKSPHELMTGRQAKLKLDLLKPPVKEARERNEKMENQFNKHHKAVPKDFQIGDEVFVKVFSNNKKWHWVPAEVFSKKGNVNYEVVTNERKVLAHANHLKKRYTYLDNGENILLDTFDIHIPTHDDVEPEIFFEPQDDSEDSFEDALDQTADEIVEEFPEEPRILEDAQQPRRTQRATAGVPPS